MSQPGITDIDEVDLGRIARNHHARALPKTGQHHLHLKARGVLGFIHDDKSVRQGAAAEKSDRSDFDFALLTSASQLLSALEYRSAPPRPAPCRGRPFQSGLQAENPVVRQLRRRAARRSDGRLHRAGGALRHEPRLEMSCRFLQAPIQRPARSEASACRYSAWVAVLGATCPRRPTGKRAGPGRPPERGIADRNANVSLANVETLISALCDGHGLYRFLRLGARLGVALSVRPHRRRRFHQYIESVFDQSSMAGSWRPATARAGDV